MATTTARTDFDNTRYTKILQEEMNYATNRDTLPALLTKTETTTERSIRDTSISAPKLMTQVGENGIAPLSTVQQGFVSEIAWNRYSIQFEVTDEAQLVDQHDAIMGAIKDQASQVAKTQDYAFGGIFRNATTNNLADGVPLLSASHALRSGATQANTFTDVQKPLTYDTLLEGVDYLNRMKTNSGERVSRNRNKNFTILIPNEMGAVERAYQLIGKQANEMKPGAENNDVNFFKKFEGAKFNLIVSDSLNLSTAQDMGETTTLYTDSGASAYSNRWFLMDEDMVQKLGAFKKIIAKDREQKSKIIETESLSIKMLLYSYFGFGCTPIAPLAIFGSKGDNSATNF
jgi:hypothetical protein